MAQKKHPKLPNGFGSIKKLSGSRSNPYAVYPPTTEFAANGSPKTPKALCYVADWYTGFYALMEYGNGTFNPDEFSQPEVKASARAYDAVSRIIASNNNQTRGAAKQKTFSQVYEEFYVYKYERDKTRTYSRSSTDATKAAYAQAGALHGRLFRELKTEDLQSVIDLCDRKYATM